VGAFVDRHRVRFGVEPICREIGVSASAYRAMPTRPPSVRARRDAFLVREIESVHRESFATYGQWRTWKQLRRDGIRMARCTVERLMRREGIEGICRGKAKPTTTPGAAPVPAPDLVRRDFSASRPDELWLCHFTYVRTWQGWSYLAIVLDVYTRRIVGWQLAEHMRQSLVSDALQMALSSRQEHSGGLIAHTDNGSQHTSFEYSERLRKAAVAPAGGAPARRSITPRPRASSRPS